MTIPAGRPVPATGGSAAGTPDTGTADAGPPRLVDLLLALLLALLAAVIALVVVAFLPARAGSVPVPMSIVLAGAALIALPRACYRLTGSVLAALAPALVWFVVTAWTVLHRNPLYPQQPLAVGDWRLVVLMLVGGSCAALTVGGLWASRIRGRDLRAADAGPSGAQVTSHGAGADSGWTAGAVDTEGVHHTPPDGRAAGTPPSADSGRGERTESNQPGGEAP